MLEFIETTSDATDPSTSSRWEGRDAAVVVVVGGFRSGRRAAAEEGGSNGTLDDMERCGLGIEGALRRVVPLASGSGVHMGNKRAEELAKEVKDALTTTVAPAPPPVEALPADGCCWEATEG